MNLVWICAKYIHYTCNFNKIQESPPAWTQEAYCPPCSEYSFCCPILADPPPSWTWPPLPLLDLTPPPPGWTWPTTPRLDLTHPLDLTPLPPSPPAPQTWPPQLDLTPPAGPDPPQLDLTPPAGPDPLPAGPDPPPAGPDPPCGQTNKVKLLPSRHTTYTGGKNAVRIPRCIYISCNYCQ